MIQTVPKESREVARAQLRPDKALKVIRNLLKNWRINVLVLTGRTTKHKNESITASITCGPKKAPICMWCITTASNSAQINTPFQKNLFTKKLDSAIPSLYSTLKREPATWSHFLPTFTLHFQGLGNKSVIFPNQIIYPSLGRKTQLTFEYNCLKSY